jgi:hypothetical protein
LKRKVDPKHYQIFDLYFFKHWPVAKVARALQVNTAKVYLVKHRLGGCSKRKWKSCEPSLYEIVTYD